MVNAFAILALSSVFTTLSLSAPVESVPREPRNIFPQGPSVAVVLDLPTASPLPPPGSTGSFYGNEDLLDYDGNPVQGSLIVEDVKLVPGQLADPNDGLILDFNLIDKPQPIRDTTRESGGTDPGPGIFCTRYETFFEVTRDAKTPAAITSSRVTSSPHLELTPGESPKHLGQWASVTTALVWMELAGRGSRTPIIFLRQWNSLVSICVCHLTLTASYIGIKPANGLTS